MTKQWTEEEVTYVCEHYPFERAVDVGNAIGRSPGAVMHVAREHGVHKDAEALSKIKSISNSGKNSGNFKGYRQRTKDGYIWCRAVEHPFANHRGYVKEHRLVMEKHLGFILPKKFVVHHLNGIKDDNRIENLAVMTVGAHSTLHGKMGRDMPKGPRNHKYKEVDVDAMEKMLAEGYTVDQICKKFNICRQTYYRKTKGRKA